MKITKDRQTKLRARLEEAGAKTSQEAMEWVRDILRLILGTPFLLGENKRGWKADFDWLIANATNWVKVREGKYGEPMAQEKHPNPAPSDPALGVGEWRERDGRRTYGIGMVTVPNTAPPRPSASAAWNGKAWVDGTENTSK